MDKQNFQFTCGECGKVFPSLEDLQKHERSTHGDRDEVRREPEEPEISRTG